MIALIASLAFSLGTAAQIKTPASNDAIRSFYESGLKRNGIVGSSLVLIQNDRAITLGKAYAVVACV